MAQSTLSYMNGVLWSQYPLGSQLSMSLLARQLTFYKLYLAESFPDLFTPFRSSITRCAIEFNQLRKTQYEFWRILMKELPLAGTLMCIIIYVLILLISVIIFSLHFWCPLLLPSSL